MIDLSILNGPQREAVVHEGGPLVVFAGAGSGKTRVITHRVAHLIAARDHRPWQILAVTFTNKAAGEMRERLSHLLPGQSDGLWVGTFHATCARLLRKFADEVGVRKDFVIYDDQDQRAMVTRVLRDLGLDEKRYDPKQVAGRINRAKQEVVGPEHFPTASAFDEVVGRVYRAYDERMKLAGALDFDDLIYRMVRALESSPGFKQMMQSRFAHVLVDEFQDTNRVQFRLVRGIAEAHRQLTVVGDDDQSIYRWRGADRRNILDFKHEFTDASVVKLEQNYRSTARIVRAAQAVVSRNVDREPKELFTDNAEGQKIVVVRCEDERDEARHVVRSVERQRLAGRSLGDQVVFYRIHAQSRVLEEALRAANLAYRVVGGTRFYDRAEVKDLIAYLRVLHNQDDDVSVLRIINVPGRGIGKTTIDRVLDSAARSGSGVFNALKVAEEDPTHAAATKKKLAAFVALIEDLRASMSAEPGPAALAKRVLEVTGYTRVLQDEDTAEADARIENLRELVGSMEEFEKEAESPNLASFLELVTLDTSADAKDSGDKLTLMTVHAAKGLEFPVVFVTGLEERMFPYRGVDFGDDPDEMEEERRLAYVAFTRAREELVLSHAILRRVFGQSRYERRSRFVDELPADDILETGLRPSYAPPSTPRYDSDDSGGSSYARFDSGISFRSDSRPPPAKRTEEGEAYVDRSDGDLADAPLRPGTRVKHVRFGVGQVRAVAAGDPPKITVTFPGWGTKQIVATYLELA